jgi:hypothetical protein
VEKQVLLAAYFEVFFAKYVFVVWVQLHVKHLEQTEMHCLYLIMKETPFQMC